MEAIATNKTLYNSKKFMECARKFFFKDRRIYSVVNIGLTVGFVLGGMYYVPTQDFLFASIYMFFACFCAWSAFAGYYLKAQKMYVLQDTAYGPERYYTIYSDKITIKMGSTERDISYKKISSTIETENCIGITTEDFMFIVDKNGFESGSCAQFQQLIGGNL